MELATDKMTAEKSGAVGWMVFNNPARHNAVSLEMWQAIPPILDAFEADPEIRVIALKGAGDRAFVSGADISEFQEARGDAAATARYDDESGRSMARLRRAGKPTIAMIRGYCIGGGLAIALNCDLRIAGRGSRFGIPAARLGLGYGHGGIKQLVDLVGPSFAREIFLTARQFSAGEAREMGLVNRVVPDEEIESYVADYCGRIAENAPLTIHAVRRTIDELTRMDGEPDRALLEALVRRCFDSEDYAEGRRAFMEKRKPVFQGR